MERIEQVITSLEVAEMMEMKHYQILEKLEGTKTTRGIIPTMGDHKIMVADYFRESTYDDAQGKCRKCYLITKLGCDFLANKFTGEKGIVFTAKYVKRFRDMEDVIRQPKSALEQLRLIQQATIEVGDKIDSVNEDLQDFKKTLPLLGVDLKELKDAKNRKAVPILGGKSAPAYKDNSIRGRLYKDISNQVNREFGVQNCQSIKRSQLKRALEIVNNYEAPMVLMEEIRDCNMQINFNEREEM